MKKQRDPARKAAAHHEIDLRTKTSSPKKPKYSRNKKHKGNDI